MPRSRPLFSDDVYLANARRAFVLDLLDFKAELGQQVRKIKADLGMERELVDSKRISSETKSTG